MLYTVKSQLKKEFQTYNHVGDLTLMDEKLTKIFVKTYDHYILNCSSFMCL